MSERRIFWGRTLPQAIAKAARHHGVAPESLAWRRHEKRHGFVRHQRAVLVEVDPRAPLRPPDAPPASAPRAATDSAPKLAPTAPTGLSPTPRSDLQPASQPAPQPTRRQTPPPRKMVAERNEEAWDAPDEESEVAALEAARRLLRFAGIAAVPVATRGAERIEIDLTAAEGEIGHDLLDELEHLLPRAVFTLSRRRVRVSLDAFGQRAARAEALRALATAAGERVRASGDAEILEPLSAAERRVVHLVFEGDRELATESLGDSHRKRVRIFHRQK